VAASSLRSLSLQCTVWHRIIPCYLVWPGIVALPLCLTHGDTYASVFPREWYSIETSSDGATIPKPLGLCLGIVAVAIGHVFVVVYHYFHAYHPKQPFGAPVPIQKRASKQTKEPSDDAPKDVALFASRLGRHLCQPGGFAVLVAYLSGTWMYGLMPPSYYRLDAGGVNWLHVALQLLCVDAFQYIMHLLEHRVSSVVYRLSHKPHHKFTDPNLFDAFDGSLTDTSLMILIPLFATTRAVPVANVWSYMAFGSLYANHLSLIHSECWHCWDGIFEATGVGTPGDHHVHHAKFGYNFGHLFTYWDRLAGTYRHPSHWPASFPSSVKQD